MSRFAGSTASAVASCRPAPGGGGAPPPSCASPTTWARRKGSIGCWSSKRGRSSQMAPLFDAAARPEVGGSPAFSLTAASGADSANGDSTVLEAHEIVFRYPDRGAPILRGCNLRIRAGDRLLLEGPSGGGKSTLASLLSGLRVPESGLLLLRGLDPQTLGTEGWRRRVVAAPQFHENHVLTETFAFKLLMGRRWPPQPADVEAAERICRELGLDDLLSRMPAGLLQMVGETGWQLSHRGRSRLYIGPAPL